MSIIIKFNHFVVNVKSTWEDKCLQSLQNLCKLLLSWGKRKQKMQYVNTQNCSYYSPHLTVQNDNNSQHRYFNYLRSERVKWLR